MSLNDRQKKYILSLYKKGLRNPWHIGEKDIGYLQTLNDYDKLIYDSQNYLLDLDRSLSPETYPKCKSRPGL